jgi:hypothetical protein
LSAIEDILAKNTIPRMLTVKQHMPRPRVENVDQAVREAIEEANVLDRIKPGMRVAITGGSRGINNMVQVYKTLVQLVRSLGAEPFIFPAMGSHGGATAQGQVEVLKHLGVTEDVCGCPIISSMETDLLGYTKKNGLPAYIDHNANLADAIILVNRVKLHTSFRGNIESGLCKMAVIGMGKQKGAELCHSRGWDLMLDSILDLSETIISKSKTIFGIALVENGYDETAIVSCLPAEKILEGEQELLIKAKEYMPSIPFKDYDILIVDVMGKEYSGGGMDTNVISRYPSTAVPPDPRQKIIAVLDLSEGSMGNAIGVGMADITTSRLFGKWNMEASYINNLTNGTLQNYKMPMVMNSDKNAIRAALQMCRLPDPSKAKVVRIHSTLELSEFQVSEALLDEAKGLGLELCGEAKDIIFDENGNLF